MNSFGSKFKVSIFGESHGAAIGITIDGCPAGIPLSKADFMPDIERRKSGAPGTTPRQEADEPNLVSGVFNEHTTGAPITIMFENTNIISKDYTSLRATPRPGHADFVLDKKHNGFNDYRGGGHSSGRLTLPLVAAGVVAKKAINSIHIEAKLIEAGGNTDIEAAIATAIQNQDSIGGIIECRVNNLPIGLGEPFFDSVESLISHLIFSIPAVKGIAFGSGFDAVKMTGSQHNDAIMNNQGQTATNHAGGINGGITNGNEVYFTVAMKPTSSTPQTQQTWNHDTQTMADLTIKGRHDLCIALRAPVVVEAVTAIAFANLI